MPNRFRLRTWFLACLSLVLPVLVCAQGGTQPTAGTTTNATVPALTVAITGNAAGSSLITTHGFWMEGGMVEICGSLHNGLGDTASISGFHAGDSGQGVPVNLVVATFGPRYSFVAHVNHHPMILFTQALVGEAFGFGGVYPTHSGPTPSADSLAFQPGGGADVPLTPHISLRVLQVDYLYTRLPNSSLNYQNNLRIGAGIVFRKAAKAR